MQETSCARRYPRVELLQSSSIQLIPQQNGDPTPPHNRSQKFPEHVGKLETLQEDVRVKKHQETVLMASPILRRRLAELWRGTPPSSADESSQVQVGSTMKTSERTMWKCRGWGGFMAFTYLKYLGIEYAKFAFLFASHCLETKWHSAVFRFCLWFEWCTRRWGLVNAASIHQLLQGTMPNSDSNNWRLKCPFGIALLSRIALMSHLQWWQTVLLCKKLSVCTNPQPRREAVRWSLGPSALLLLWVSVERISNHEISWTPLDTIRRAWSCLKNCCNWKSIQLVCNPSPVFCFFFIFMIFSDVQMTFGYLESWCQSFCHDLAAGKTNTFHLMTISCRWHSATLQASKACNVEPSSRWATMHIDAVDQKLQELRKNGCVALVVAACMLIHDLQPCLRYPFS